MAPVKVPELAVLKDPSGWITSEPEPMRVPSNAPRKYAANVYSMNVLPSAVRTDVGEKETVTVPFA